MRSTNENMLIGKRLKQARDRAGLTQSRLHDLTGISITQISAYENGNRNIGLSSLKKISEALGVSMDELYCGRGEDRPIASSTDKGKLIVNCISALFENGVIRALYREKGNDYVQEGLERYYQIGFCNYVDILDDFVKKLMDFEKNIDNYPWPEEFKKQLMEAASKQINVRLSSEKTCELKNPQNRHR